MKILTTQEKEMVRSLIKLTESGRSIKVEDFLKDSYFKEKFGRALIIQTGGKYSVLFLKKEVYDDLALRANEIADFLNVITFINHLVNEGHITVYKNTPNEMYYLQDGFNAPKIVNDTLVFNTKGDYSTNPDTIYNSSNEVIYKGILYRGIQHNYIVQLACGSLLASPTLAQLLDTPAPPKPKPAPPQPTPSPTPPQPKIDKYEQPPNPMHNQQNFAPISQQQGHPGFSRPTEPKKRNWTKHIPFIWGLSILNLLLIGALIYLFSTQNNKHQAHNEQFLKIDSTYTKLKDTIAHHKVLIDEIVSRKPEEKRKPIEPYVEKGQEGTYYGIDISHYNGEAVSYLTNHDSVSFIITKATQGTHYKDPYLGTNWNIIKEKKLILGVYHFYETNKDPVKQAEFFWNTITKYGRPDITPIVDIETASFPKNRKPELDKLHKNLIIFLNELEKKSDRIPMIYTNYLFANKYLFSRKFKKYPLWLAEYTSNRRPKIPKTWRDKGFKIWQRQDNYQVHHHNTDFDVYYGKLSDLTK